MALIAELAADWDRLDERDRLIRSSIPAGVHLGFPARLRDEDGTEWACFSDRRIDLVDAAYYGALRANPDLIPSDFRPPLDTPHKTVGAEVRPFLESVVVLPDAIEFAEDGSDPFTVTLEAQGADNTIRIFGSRPTSWLPTAEPPEPDSSSSARSPQPSESSEGPSVEVVGRTTSRAVQSASLYVVIGITDRIIDAAEDDDDLVWAEMLRPGLVRLRELVESGDVPSGTETALRDQLRATAVRILGIAGRGAELALAARQVLEILR